MKSLLFALFLCLFNSILFAQQNERALQYYSLTNKAELAICDSNLAAASQFYTKAFSLTAKPYSMDLNNAFKCAMDLKKHTDAEQYFKKLLSRGIQSNGLKSYLNSKDSLLYKKWIAKYPNDTAKYEHPLRKAFVPLLETDQAVRRYYTTLNDNYMTDSVYKVDSLNAQLLYNLFAQYGHCLPNEDLIGSMYSATPYELIIIHHLGPKNRKDDLFDTLMYNALFDLALHPNVYVPLAQRKFNKNKSFCFNNDCIKFPLTISIAKFEDSLFPEYLAPEIEAQMNQERAKIGLCTLDELRKKDAFNYQHRRQNSFLSKYGFSTGIFGYLEGSSLEEVLDWDKKNEPYKPKN